MAKNRRRKDPKQSKSVKKDMDADPEHRDSPVVAKKGVEDQDEGQDDVEDATSVPKKGAPEDRNGRIVPKKGVEDQNDEGGSSKVVPKKGVGEVGNTTPQPAVPTTNPVYKHRYAKYRPEQNCVFIFQITVIQITSHNPSKPSVEIPKSKVEEVAHPKSNVRGPASSSPNVPSTSLVVGVVFAVTLLSAVGFLGFKKLRAVQRRREYRKMNDFLIDGMYNDL